MSRPPQKKQVLTLNDVSQQVIALSAASKEGLGPLLTGTLYEALSSTLVDLEELSGAGDAKKSVVISNNQAGPMPGSSNAIEISVGFLTAVVNAGPTWPTTLLLCKLLSYVVVDAKNVAIWTVFVQSLVKILNTKDVAASRVAALECLGVLLKTKSILLSPILRNTELYDVLFKQIKSHQNVAPLAQVRSSLFRSLEGLILGVGFGQPLPQVHDTVSKIFKYWASCTEKSLQVRAAAARCLTVWLPFAASSYAAIQTIQQIVLRELPSYSAFGHVYGVLLYTALKESCTKEAVQPATNLPPPKPGAPPHDSAGILGFKEYESLEAILDHFAQLWARLGSKRESRESLACAHVNFLSRISFQFLEKKLSLVLGHLFGLVSMPFAKVYGAELEEAKSSLSYIIRSGLIAQFTEDGKRLVFKELLTMLEASIKVNAAGIDASRVSMLLAEVYTLFSEVGESAVDIVSSSGSGNTIESVLWELIQGQSVELATPLHKSRFSSQNSPLADGNGLWLWAGLILKRYCTVNDQYFISIEKLQASLPTEASAAASRDPLPLVWAYASTKRSRPASSAEFAAVLKLAQTLLSGTPTLNATVAGWMLISSLLIRGTHQSADQDRASMVSSHITTLQALWKQELSKRPTNDADITEFAQAKLWLLFSLQHFLANFSRLTHESNLTTFITQCLNTVLKAITTWQATNSLPKAERDCAAIDALVVTLLNSYTTLATHIFNPPTTMSPRQQAPALSTSSDATGQAGAQHNSFPARSVLQLIAKLMTRSRYTATTWLTYKYLHPEDDSLELNATPNDGSFPANSTLFADLHGCTSTVAHASNLLWSEWSSALLRSRPPPRTGGASGASDAMSATSASGLQSAPHSDSAILYMPPNQVLISEMAALFPPLFHQQQTTHQQQLIQFLSSILASNTSLTSSVHSTILFFLLAIAKENSKLSGSHQVAALMAASPSSMQNKPLSKEVLSQIVAIATPYVTSTAPFLRRLAADILAFAVDADESGFLPSTIKSLQSSLWTACGFTGSTPPSQHPPVTQSLAKLIKDESAVEGNILALGAIHRVVGGIRSRQVLGDTIKVLTAIVRITFETRPAPGSQTPASPQHVALHRTALHGLWITLEATGLSDTSFASSTLGMMLDGLVSDAAKEWQTICHMGCIIGAIAAVLGPELQGSESLIRRLQGAIVLLDCVGHIEVLDAPVSYNSSSPAPLGSDWVPPRTLAPTCLAFSAATSLRERLLLFAPQFIDAQNTRVKLLQYVRCLRRSTDFDDGSKDAATTSPISRMRLHALRVLRFLAQLNPQAFQNDEVVRQVILCTDREPLESAVRTELRVLISTLEETLVPLDPLKWLAYATHFVMGAESDVKLEFNIPSKAAASSTPTVKKPSSSAKPTAAASSSKPGAFGADDEDNEGDPMDEAMEEMAGINALSAPVIERVSADDDSSIWILSSSLTAMFVSSIHFVFEPLKSQSAHFDAILAAKRKRDAQASGKQVAFLVDSIAGIVNLASKASSAPIAILQLAGIDAIHDILECFSEAADPSLEDHYLLELYVAQLGAALRRCISRESPVANSVCHTSFAVLAELLLWIAKHVSDVAGLRQLLRPFLDAALEKKPLHSQTIVGAPSEAENDSILALEMNPRYLAWLMSSALLWQGCDALASHLPSAEVVPGTSPLPPGIKYLQDSFNHEQKLRTVLRGGWMSVLEYRAVQQYSQDLTQLTLFGSSSAQSGAQNDILSRALSVGLNWTAILQAMTTQYAEHVWVSMAEAPDTSVCAGDLSRDAHIIFGLVLHSLSSVVYITPTLKALERMMRSLSQLEKEQGSPEHCHHLLPLPSAAISELAQSLANLLGVIHYRDYKQKADVLSAAAATVEYCGRFNMLPPNEASDSHDSFFKTELGKHSNSILLKDVFLESTEHGANVTPSSRHNISYLVSLLKSLISAWPILRPSESQHAEVVLWLSKLPTLNTPDLPPAKVAAEVVPLALDFWELISASYPEIDASLIKFALSRVNSLAEKNEWKEESVAEATFLTSALIRSISVLPSSFFAAQDLYNSVFKTLCEGTLVTYGNSIVALRTFIQKNLVGGEAQLQPLALSALSVLLPVLCRQLSATANVNLANITRSELDARQEVLKVLVLVQNAPGLPSAGAEARTALVLAGLIRLLSANPLPTGSAYVPIHDSALAVLLHLAQSSPEPFKAAFSTLEAEERQLFEASVRAQVERQQALQAAQQAGKMKFSLDTSQYTK